MDGQTYAGSSLMLGSAAAFVTARCGDLLRVCSDDQSDFGDELDHCPGDVSDLSIDGGVG